MSEMFDNPLYGSVAKAHGRGKDQEHSQRDHLTPPDHTFGASKSPDRESDRRPMPTPRNRSFTCSENRLQPPSSITSSSSLQKKPVVPSRSEGAVGHNRPPLPSKCPQNPKPRDYRESSEIPVIKQRPPGRPGQPQPHGNENSSFTFPTYKFTDNLSHATSCSSLAPSRPQRSDL